MDSNWDNNKKKWMIRSCELWSVSSIGDHLLPLVSNNFAAKKVLFDVSEVMCSIIKRLILKYFCVFLPKRWMQRNNTGKQYYHSVGVCNSFARYERMPCEKCCTVLFQCCVRNKAKPKHLMESKSQIIDRLIHLS